MPDAVSARRAADPSRPWLALVLAVSLAALALALVGQFAFGLEPCVLCLYERIPYLAAAIVAGLGLLLPLASLPRRRLLGLAGVIFACGAGLALYHVGIEQAWWTSAIPGCSGRPVGAMTPEGLAAGILRPLRSCTDVDFRVAGLSLAGWNVLASTALAVGCFGIVRLLAARAA